MNEQTNDGRFGRILVVDDTTANLQLLTNLLTKHGYTVHPASEGELALEFVRSTLPDLILLDIRMPGMDGYEVCGRLKADERTRDIPVIFISILEDASDKVKGFRQGAVDYITKPFQPEEVLARVRIHLSLRKLTERLEQNVSERTEELTIANQRLQQEVAERKQAEEEIFQLNADLEQRVAERTSELEMNRLELQENQLALINIVEDLNAKSEELRQANAKMQELDRLKSMFIASMSHELRTPLNSIIGFSSILRDEWIGPVNTEQKENLSTILRSSKHLLSLINDAIDVSKIESGKIEISSRDFDVSDVISEAVELIKKDLQDKGLELKVEPIHLVMHTDRRRLLQCVINLISNAVKFTQKGSVRVHVHVISGTIPHAAVDGILEISVEDTGIGIKEEDISRLFNAFVRVHSSQVVSVKGTGLGLYLTKKIVTEILGGEISVESNYGKGSRFVIRIPVKHGLEAGK